jgi:hypothetical protein
MAEWIEQLTGWTREHRELLGWLAIFSFVTFTGTLVLIPLLVIRMRPDYFRPGEEGAKPGHPVTRLVLRLLKDLAGVVFVLAGIAMLFIPGQGILTILIGITLLDFPGKRKLELKLVRIPTVKRAIDWMRAKAKREPLDLPE